MKLLNIWLIQPGESLPILKSERKMRTALLGEKLVERGNNLLWWASAYEHQRKIWLSNKDKNFHINSNYTIRVLHGTGYKKNISIARYIDHLVVARKFKLQSGGYNQPDIIVASMPCYHFAYEAMRYARRHKIPFIVDIRDLWPDIFLGPSERLCLRRLGRLFLSRDYVKLTNLLRQADSIVAVSKGYLEWGLNMIGRIQNSWDRVFYLGYKINDNTPSNHNLNISSDSKKKNLFLFVGTFGKSYEIELIIDTARRFNMEGNTDILFYIAGTGEKYETIKSSAGDLSNVFLSGWIDGQKIRALLAEAWVGIVPCKSIEHTAPNKVFEYLSAGLPLISSLEGEIADLIQRYRIGVNYKAGDSEELYQCVKKLSGDTNLRNDMSQAASFFFKEFGDADRIYDEYANHIEKLVEFKNEFVKPS